jgi:hypothetical protein
MIRPEIERAVKSLTENPDKWKCANPWHKWNYQLVHIYCHIEISFWRWNFLHKEVDELKYLDKKIKLTLREKKLLKKAVIKVIKYYGGYGAQSETKRKEIENQRLNKMVKCLMDNEDWEITS